ncbi:UEV-domain-containing protein [Ganoderma leucocontextum]|nr:UEV-domain-containing protein [Ganoderma leucocontextum]
MSKAESLTHRWLRQNIQPYAHPDVVFTHVDAVLLRQPAIRPKTDVYTYDDGRTQLLLCIHGLLPIAFRGTSYNIPIAIWLPRDYPRSTPIAYVVPTNDMLVRPSPEIDVSGRCSVQYIHNWERKSEGCNLIGLLDALHEIFSREPPVYAKPKDAAPVQTPSPRPPASTPFDYPHRPPPPLPVDRPGSIGAPVQSTPSADANLGGPPPVPAKPGGSAAFSPSSSSPAPLTQASANDPSRSLASFSSPALAMRPPPPLPQEAIATSQSNRSPGPPSYTPHDRNTAGLSSNNPAWSARMQSNPPNQPRSLHTLHPATRQTPSPPPPPPPPPAPSATITNITSPVVYGRVSQQPYPMSVSPGQPRYVYSQPPPPMFSAPQPMVGALETSHPNLTSPSSHAAPPPPFPPAFSPPAPLPPPPPAPPSSAHAPDLLDGDSSTASPSYSAAPAVVPPRPPNPELLRLHDQVHARISSELASLSQAMALDAERLRANQTDLLAGEPAIRDEMARLEAVRDVCRGVSARLEQVVAVAERNVAELKRKGDPEVDEMVCSTTIVYNQLITLVAEDNAIEDTIYHLHRAVNAGHIDLERFLRTTRVLAEEQFMKRALIEKIQAGIPRGSSDGTAWADVPSQWR